MDIQPYLQLRSRRGVATAAGALVVLLAAAPVSANHDLYRQISRGAINGNGPTAALWQGVSANGARVFFSTTEALVAADADAQEDVYERSFGTTKRLSLGTINGNGASAAFYSGASDDGSRVFFTTLEKLLPTDTDNAYDVYQRSGNTTTLVSAGAINGNGAYAASYMAASKDGTKVFFATFEKLVPADTDNSIDVYQRSGNTTTLISAGQINGNGALDVEFSGASASGDRVWFMTTEKLVAADTDMYADIYERSNGQTFRVSRGQINGNALFNVIFNGAATDGSRVFFSTLERLHPSDTDEHLDLYAFNGGNGTVNLISAGQINGNGAFHANFRAASEDGSRVFFGTDEKLVGADLDAETDIYERSGGVTKLISYGVINGNGPFDVTFGGISADGSRVVFETDEKLVVPDVDGFQDVYARSGNTLERISASASAGNAGFSADFDRISADGSRVFFSTSEQMLPTDSDVAIDLYERVAGSTHAISNGNGGFGVTLQGMNRSASAVFFSSQEQLLPTDEDGAIDVYGAYLD